jgi:hypothetical protein
VIIGGSRELHNEKFHYVISSPNIIIMIKSTTMRWAEHVASTREMINLYRLFMAKREVKRRLGRPGRR